MATYAQLISFGPRFSGGRLCTLRVYHYTAGTTTLRNVYTDREKTTTAAQPATSNSDGMVNFYADGLYKFRIDGSTDGSTWTTLDTIDKWAVVDQSTTLSGEGAAIASASTLVLGSDGDFFHVTGSTGPIGIISGSQTHVTLVFDSTPTLTHSGSLILQQGLTYTAVANDTFVFINEGASIWREVSRNSSTTGIQAAASPIINGNMDIWQRGSSFVAAADSTYTADRWRWGQVGTGVVTLSRSTNVPTVGSAGVLLNYSLDVDVTTVDAAIAAGDVYVVTTRIEGYNWRHFAQRQFTVSFWVFGTKMGVHCVAFRNSASTADRSYVAEYTILETNTWEYKTITIPASPSAGTWDYAATTGLEIVFALACGSTLQTTANAWATGHYYSTANQVNVMDSTSNFFRVTGIRLDLGAVAGAVQFRQFQDELAQCQRYYQKSFAYASTPAQGISAGEALQGIAGKAGALSQSIYHRFAPPLRTTPTVITYNPSAANAQMRDQIVPGDMTATTATEANTTCIVIAATGHASTAVGNRIAVHWTADAEL